LIATIHDIANHQLAQQLPFEIAQKDWYAESVARLGDGSSEPAAWTLASRRFRASFEDIVDDMIDLLRTQTNAVAMEYLPCMRTIIAFDDATRDLEEEAQNLPVRKSRKRHLYVPWLCAKPRRPKRYLALKVHDQHKLLKPSRHFLTAPL